MPRIKCRQSDSASFCDSHSVFLLHLTPEKTAILTQIITLADVFTPPPPASHCENGDFEVAARDNFSLRHATCINDTNLERSHQALPRRLLFMHQKDKQHMLKCRASVFEQTLSTRFGGENMISPERARAEPI